MNMKNCYYFVVVLWLSVLEQVIVSSFDSPDIDELSPPIRNNTEEFDGMRRYACSTTSDGQFPNYDSGDCDTDEFGSLQDWPVENQTDIIHDGSRDSRILFTIVKFANIQCTAGGETGVCTTEKECTGMGGRVVGSCARGFGSCCFKTITCGGSSSTNCTTLLSPDYPAAYNEARTCTMRITRGDGICQLRLDVMEFTSSQPNNNGVCQEDQFTVTGERKFTYLCGTAPDNWHFYLDVNGRANPTEFNFATSSTSFDRKFKIKVTMIPCDQKIPGGCGQYFTGTTGTFESFNFGSGPYLAGLNYAICFRKEKNFCTTTLTNDGTTFISCPDLYRLPVGESNGNTIIASSNVRNLYCQIPLAFPGFNSVIRVPSPINSVSNGPFSIWHFTNVDTASNFRPGCTSCAGYSQTFTHNSC